MKSIIYSFVALSFLLISCNNDKKNRSTEECLSSFLNENPTIAVFGKAKVQDILNKIDYKSVPKFGPILNSVISEFNKTLNIESPIFYAIEGPFSQNGTPTSFYAFIEVKNADSLVLQLTQKGYDFDKEGKLNYTQFGNLSLGIENHLAILISKPNKYNSKEELKNAFEKTLNKPSNLNVNKMLAANGDVVVGVNLESIYSTSNTELNKLSEDKKKEIENMVQNSYSQIIFKFENGEAIVETKNYFSDELNKKLFFKSDSKGTILTKLGSGKPRVGLSLNLDMGKIQQFINEYSPESISKLGEMLGGPAQMALMMGGEESLAGLFTGELGFVLVGEPGANGSMIPDFNAFLGLGKKGKDLAEMASSFLSQGTMKAIINKDGIACYSSAIYSPKIGKTIEVPIGCEIFGKKAITGFVNFEGMDIRSFELEGAAKIINIVKYISFEMDENGSKLRIKALKGKENILKQSVEFLLTEFESKISGLPL